MIFINTELILNHLLKVKQIGAEHWVALCPCHDDHRPSLDVAVKNNKILMACPVCGADGVRVMETLGLGTRELFEEQSQYPNQSIQKRDRPASVDYLYNDRLKKTRYYTWDDKKQAWRKCFCWYHNEGGEWQKGKGAETPPLYKTANIGWARDRHRTLYIAEGEKDVDTLTQKLHLPAVCSPHGAGRGRLESKWDERYNDLFTGCDVAILADNDEPGREFARYVANQIAPYAASVRLPDMSFEWDWLPEKGDITDVLERDTPIRGKTVAETVKFRLEALTDTTPLYEPPKEKSPFIRLSDVQSVDTEWLWYPYIPMGKITLMTADPGTGKTFLALYLAAMTSKGCPFYGEESAWREGANVVYQTAEDGIADTIKPRLEPMKPNFDNIYVFDESEKSLDLSDERVEKIMQSLHPRLMVFDPLQAYLGTDVDMHRANEVRPVMGRIERLAEKYNCAVVFIMHHSKATQNSALHRALGSMDIPAVARSMLILANDPDGGKLICHEKSSLAPRGKTIRFDVAPHLGGVTFAGFSDLRADDVLNLRPEGKKKGSPKRDELCDKILEMFGDEEEIEVPKRDELCDQLDCSVSTLRRVKSELGISTVKKGFGDETKYYWQLSEI